jgi:UDP-N-acetyl-D-glucosamine dehydrogenase
VPALPELGLESAPLPAAADGVDLAIIVTAHPQVDHRDITERAQLTLDLRGVTRGLGAAALQL